MSRSTSRVRRRTRKASRSTSDAGVNPWLDFKLLLLTPTPKQRQDWEHYRSEIWQLWADLPPKDRPRGSELAPAAAIAIDWNNHLGPVFDERGRQRSLTPELLDEYEAIAGPGFAECRRTCERYMN